MGLARLGAGRPRLVVVLALLLSLASAWVVATRFSLDSDVSDLFPADLPWRQTEQDMARAFPDREDLIAIVVDASTGEAADRAAAALAEALAPLADPQREGGGPLAFVRRPDALPFFRRNALLFLPTAEVQALTERIIEAQPLLGTLSADPGLRGLASALGLVLEGVARGATTLDSIALPLAWLADAAEAALAGRTRPLDWGALFTGRQPGPLELRRFVLAKPRLDFAALSPGEAATAAIREAITRLGLTPEHGIRVRLTGQIPMADEEFASVADGALRNTLLSLALVALLLWRALGSARLILPVLATLLVGLLVTAAFGALVIGPYNPLSIAFAVLFIGLGVDFGIQFAVRAREQLQAHAGIPPALAETGRLAGPGVALAAAAIALGFLAFLPTDYRGVSELGAIAGFGMLAAGFLSLTLLPALLVLARPRPGKQEVGLVLLVPLDGWIARHARAVVVGAGLTALAAAACLPRLAFDFDPLNLRDPNSEAVATFRDLLGERETTPNTLNVLVAEEAAAAALAARLAALPEASQVLTIGSFIPEDQPEKLALLQDAADLLGLTLAPAELRPPATDAETAAALAALAEGLAARAGPAAAAADAGRLATALRGLAAADAAARARLEAALIPGLRGTLAQLDQVLRALPVLRADLPAELVRDWISPDGRARVEVFPASTAHDNRALRRFSAAVLAAAPQATGTAISILASSGTIRHAFILAGILAAALSLGLLLLVLADLRLALLALAPLALAGLLTLATCALLGPALNLANIVALPLLFGIGIAFDIYYVVAWRAGLRGLLPSPITRAVLFSALTTASAFGTLAFSAHPGTASMGVLLAMSLGYTLAAVLVVLPALLRVFASGEARPGAPPPSPHWDPTRAAPALDRH